MRVASRLILLVVLIGVLVSCAITSGSTFSGVLATEPASEPASEVLEPASDVALSVETDPEAAAVWLDNEYIGRTPLRVEQLAPGTYRLRIEREGYYPVKRWIEIGADRTLVLDVQLEQITGLLLVRTEPDDAEVSIDGETADAGLAELAIGPHDVRVRRFGYRDETLRATVHENEVTKVSVSLESAPFDLTSVSVSRDRFNPRNPGATGVVRLNFEVSAPGTGSLAVSGPAGEPLSTMALGSFTTWNQSIQWPGPTAPADLPDGPYVLELDLVGEDGREVHAAEIVTIDASLEIRYRTVWNSTPGLLYGPAPAPLPFLSAQGSFAGAGIVTVADGGPVARIPMKAGLRFGAGNDIEFAAYAGIIANTEPLLDRWTAGASVAWYPRIPIPGALTFRSGLALGAAYRTPTANGLYSGSDTLTDFPGFFATLPVAVQAGPLGLAVALEYRRAPAPVVFDGPPLPNAWTSYLYGRAAATVETGGLTVGLSAAVRSTPLSPEVRIDTPMQAGLEVHWIVPETALVLSGFAAGEFSSPRDFYVMGGAGLGVLF